MQAPGLSRLDPATNRVTAEVPIGGPPSFWGVGAGEGSVWVAQYSPGEVLRIDPKTMTVIERIEVGPTAGALAVGAGGVWVAVPD